MKMVNEMELNQVNGGGTLGNLINKAKDLFETAQDIYDAYTGGGDNDITVTHNEDGTVTASGGW